MGFRPRAGLEGIAMELFTQLFGDLLAFVYHGFDRIVIYGYLSGLSRPEQVMHFFRQVVGVPVVGKEILSQRTADYQNWVEAFARNHRLPIEWAEISYQRPQIRHQGSKLPHPRPPTQPLHALLLLPLRRNPGPDGDAGRLVLSVPDHLLPQRAQLHRAGAEARADRLPQDRQRLPRRRRRRRAASRRRQTQPANHPPTARLLDPDPGTEVLRQGAQAAQSLALLRDRPD